MRRLSVGTGEPRRFSPTELGFSRTPIIEKALAEMPAPQRSVLALKDVEGPSFAEFSHTVGISAPDVRALLQHGPPAPVVGDRRLSERTLPVEAAAAIGEPDGRR